MVHLKVEDSFQDNFLTWLANGFWLSNASLTELLARALVSFHMNPFKRLLGIPCSMAAEFQVWVFQETERKLPMSVAWAQKPPLVPCSINQSESLARYVHRIQRLLNLLRSLSDNTTINEKLMVLKKNLITQSSKQRGHVVLHRTTQGNPRAGQEVKGGRRKHDSEYLWCIHGKEGGKEQLSSWAVLGLNSFSMGSGLQLVTAPELSSIWAWGGEILEIWELDRECGLWVGSFVYEGKLFTL